MHEAYTRLKRPETNNFFQKQDRRNFFDGSSNLGTFTQLVQSSVFF